MLQTQSIKSSGLDTEMFKIKGNGQRRGSFPLPFAKAGRGGRPAPAAAVQPRQRPLAYEIAAGPKRTWPVHSAH